MLEMNSRTLRLLATTSLIGLSLSIAPLSLEFSPDNPFVKMAQAKCCFTAGTRVLMADGSTRPIETLRPGDRVLGGNGEINRVVGIERPKLGERQLYALNGGQAFVTAEHPFMTTNGWRSIDPAATANENPGLAVERLRLGECLMVLRSAPAPKLVGNLALAAEPFLEPLVLLSLRAQAAAPDTRLYNLLLDGGHSYFANGYLVHNKGGDSGGGGEGGGGDGGNSGPGGGGGEGSGGEDGGNSGPGGGEGGDDGGEGGEAGDGGEAGENGESVVPGSSGSGGSGSGSDSFGDVHQVGPDLSSDEEADAISKGWE